jgi:hypothetical protein
MWSALAFSGARRVTWRNARQRRDERLIIIRANPVKALETANQAAVGDDLLTIRTLKDADWLHHPFAVASAVA